MIFELVICDLDGTLVDSFADIRWGLASALAAIGRDQGDEIARLANAGVSLEDCYQSMTGNDATATEHAQELAAFVDGYRASYWDNPEPGEAYNGVAETLRQIRARLPKAALAVATTKRTAMAERVVERAGLGGIFDLVQGSDGLPKKPDPTLLHLVAKKLQRSISRSVMVGDTDKDIHAARAAGCIAVGVTYGGWGQRLAELAPGRDAHHLIDRFSDLEEIVSSPAQAGARE